MSDNASALPEDNETPLLENSETMEAAKAQYGRVQKLIEAKAWTELAEMVQTNVIIFDGYPESKEHVFEEIERMTANFTNVQFVLKDIAKFQITENTGRLSGVAQVIWDVDNSWEEQCVDIELHISISKNDEGRWYATHVGLRILPKLTPAAAALGLGSQANYFSDTQESFSISGSAAYFSDAAAPYFSAQAPNAFVDPSATTTASTRRHVVYMPVILDQETLRSLFGNP